MDEDEDGVEGGGRGSDGAGGSRDGLTAHEVAAIDIGAVTERVTSEQSAARSTPFGGEAAGVRKRDTTHEPRRQRQQEEPGQEARQAMSRSGWGARAVRRFAPRSGA